MIMKKNHDVYMVGNAHIDPVWLWRFQDGYAEIKATFAAALDRMNDYPDFVFTSACAAYYQWVEENAPDMFEEIKKRVKEGRWCISGGMWIQPDVNVPSGESFARHFLYSQRYFYEKFGIMAECGYNVDSFGHNGMLPGLLKKAGIKNYVMMRPDKRENPNMPHHLFIWEGVDGSRVLTARLTTYSHRGGDVEKHIAEGIDALTEYGFPIMRFYGVGNHGGGPTIQTINAIHEYQKNSDKDIVLSTTKNYFDDVTQYADKLPVWKGDLQHHASGCYSAMSRVKAQNRKAENRLVGAEIFSTLRSQLLGIPYCRKNMEKAWQNVLFNQFHDIMGGCSIRQAYDDAMESYGEALTIGAKMQNAALQSMSWAVDTLGEARCIRSKENDFRLWEIDNLGTPVVVFNPHAWPVYTPVQVSRVVSHVTDDSGNELALQTVRAQQTNGDDKWNTLFMADVPAMGYRLYRMYLKEINPESLKTAKSKAVVSCAAPTGSYNAPVICDKDEYYMENDFVKVKFDKATGYLGIYDKTAGKEAFVQAGCVPKLIDVEHCDTWAHGVFTFDKEAGEFADAEICALETGPIRVCMRVVSHFGKSTLRQEFYLYGDKADIEVRATLDFYEKHRMLKLCFPVNIPEGEPVVTYEIPNSFIERPANGTEESGQRFVDISSGCAAEEYGFAVINDGKYSFSASGNELRMTVAHSSIYADHYGQQKRDVQCEFLDFGEQKFAYAIVPHKGSWKNTGIARKAVEFNLRTEHVVETYHSGKLPAVSEGISISGGDSIVVAAYKRAEDLPGYILRCYESLGEEVECKISLPLLGVCFDASFNKLESKTFFIPDGHQSEVISEVLVTEMGVR